MARMSIPATLILTIALVTGCVTSPVSTLPKAKSASPSAIQLPRGINRAVRERTFREQSDLRSNNILNARSIAEKSRDTEAMEAMRFIEQETASAIPVFYGKTIFEFEAGNEANIAFIALSNTYSDRNASHGSEMWGYFSASYRAETAFFADQKLMLVPYSTTVSDWGRGITLLREGYYAMNYGASSGINNPPLDAPTVAQDKLDAFHFQLRVTEAYLGRPYRERLDDSVKKMKILFADAKQPVGGPDYYPLLSTNIDRIIGSEAESDTEAEARQTYFRMHVYFECVKKYNQTDLSLEEIEVAYLAKEYAKASLLH